MRKETEHLQYWRARLPATLPYLNLPKNDVDEQNSEKQLCTYEISSVLSKSVESFLEQYRIEANIFFLSLFKLVLHRYAEQQDLLVGMPVTNSSLESGNLTEGYFTNVILFSSRKINSQTFSQYVADLQTIIYEDLLHAGIPYPDLIKDLEIEGDLPYSGGCQVMFEYKSFIQSCGLDNFQQHYGSVGFEMEDGKFHAVEHDLALNVVESLDNFSLNLACKQGLCNEEQMEEILERYVSLVEKVLNDPDIQLTNRMLDDEKETVLSLIHAKEIPYETSKCIHEIFERQVRNRPDAIAVIYGGVQLSYRELDDKSRLLACYLQAKGVLPDSLVAICLERSIELIITILGILRAGGAYVPLDPRHPTTRLQYILEDCKADFLIGQSSLWDKFDVLSTATKNKLVIDKDWSLIETHSKKRKKIRRKVNPSNLAYVIYTSGSTGEPKGVMLEHRSVLNTLYSMQDRYPVNKNSRWLLKTNYTFDVSVTELFSWFIGGGQLVIMQPDEEKDPEAISSMILKQGITHVNFVPSMLELFLSSASQDFKNKKRKLEYVMVAGEAFSKKLLTKCADFFHKDVHIENIYGPTEASIYSTWFSIDRNRSYAEQVPIGKPLHNMTAYIVDSNLALQPSGIAGELCISGAGVARGYLNKDELTASRFIRDPYKPDFRLYRTGDLAKYTEDGNIEYLGRIDQQVKLRGYRIELGEIEHQLHSHPKVKNNVVVVRESATGKQLVAYITAEKESDSGDIPAIEELKEYLYQRLPDYMVPAFFIYLDKMPINSSGKLDRKDLAERAIKEQAGQSSDFITSMKSGDIEVKMKAIWEEILDVENIGLDTGLFDLGGDSISANWLIKKINTTFNCDLSIATLFKYSSIRSISSYITVSTKENTQPRTKTSKEPRIEGVKTTRSESDSEMGLPQYYENSLAVIGVSCHVPGAENASEFWDNLCKKKESIEQLSEQELHHVSVEKRNLAQRTNHVPVKATITGKDCFDPEFFNISPRDAEVMHPQFRHLLMHAWKAVEDAGYITKQIPNTGVFMSTSNTSNHTASPSNFNITESTESYSAWILSQEGTIPTFISHRLGFTGPSMFIQTNCSSSLAGLYAAYRSVMAGDSEYGLVGAASITSMDNSGYLYLDGLNFSSDGHLRSFDAAANGMVRGDGVAVVLVKKAVQAIKDGDHIYGLIRGIAINNDGAGKVGFYAPSTQGQTEVVRKLIDTTGIDPESIRYLEASASGTPLGDVVEFNALCDAYKPYTDKKQYCGLGSVKSNIGHLDTAAGLVGSIKVLLSLSHRQILPSINYSEPNSEIDLAHSPFYVVDKAESWEEGETPRRAALSSFGIGGTNVHAIFEEYDKSLYATDVHNKQVSNYLIPLSAKNEERLMVYAHSILVFINNNEVDISKLAYTLQMGRQAMETRVGFLVADLKQLKTKLIDYVAGNEVEDFFKGDTNQVSDVNLLLGEDEDLEGVLKQWAVKNKLAKLMSSWVSGVYDSWGFLYAKTGETYLNRPTRVSLPTYPFVQESYCFPPVNEEVSDLKRTVKNRMENTPHRVTRSLAESEQENLQEYISQSLIQILKLRKDSISENRCFWDYGVDSIVLIGLARDLEQDFNIKVTCREMLAHSSIEKLSSYLIEKCHGSKDTGTPRPKLSDYQDEQVLQRIQQYEEGKLSLLEVKSFLNENSGL